MAQLKIEDFRKGLGIDTKKITGFTEKELSELNSMDYREMKEKIVEILDSRNGDIGTCWHCGYGIYNAWIRDGAVFVEVGNTCD